MTAQLHFHFSFSCTGEGNGNPLQCSCLENPGMGEPGGLPSVGSQRVGHDWSDLAAAMVNDTKNFFHALTDNSVSFFLKCYSNYSTILSILKNHVFCHFIIEFYKFFIYSKYYLSGMWFANLFPNFGLPIHFPVFLVVLSGVQDLNSLSRDQIHGPCIGNVES